MANDGEQHVGDVKEPVEGAVVGAQVYAGAYLVLDASGNEIGAMYCEQLNYNTMVESYCLAATVGGVGTPDNKIVSQLKWAKDLFTSVKGMTDWVSDKKYNYPVHVKATCVIGGF